LKSYQFRATHLLLSFNRWEKRDEILKELEQGETHVIVKNYAFDGIAELLARGEKIDNCLHCDKGLPRPDIVFQLDVNIDEIKKRKEVPDIDFLKKKKEAYKEFHNKIYWKVIDGNKEIDEIFNTIKTEIILLRKEYDTNYGIDEIKKNFYPSTVGEDLFLENHV